MDLEPVQKFRGFRAAMADDFAFAGTIVISQCSCYTDCNIFESLEVKRIVPVVYRTGGINDVHSKGSGGKTAAVAAQRQILHG